MCVCVCVSVGEFVFCVCKCVCFCVCVCKVCIVCSWKEVLNVKDLCRGSSEFHIIIFVG